MCTIFTNLRSSLPQAHITSYTTLPLTGVTSVTDPSGKVTYYEYDSAGRLRFEKDHNSRGVKEYQYNYAQ